MPFIENLDKQKRMNGLVALCAVVSAAVISVTAIVMAYGFAGRAGENIYVLSGDTPLVAARTRQDITVDIEARAHVNLFHSLINTLPPDDKFIEENLSKAMYLTDESGLAHVNSLKEQGFYSQLISASANISIRTDSIHFDEESMKFTFYGTQRIERRTSLLYRQLVTEGRIKTTTRSDQNPDGMIITEHRTVRHNDIEYIQKSSF